MASHKNPLTTTETAHHQISNPNMAATNPLTPPPSQGSPRRLTTRRASIQATAHEPPTPWSQIKTISTMRFGNAHEAKINALSTAVQTWALLLPLTFLQPGAKTSCSLCDSESDGGEFEILKCLPCCLAVVGDECWREYVLDQVRRGKGGMGVCPFCYSVGMESGEDDLRGGVDRDEKFVSLEGVDGCHSRILDVGEINSVGGYCDTLRRQAYQMD